jgi:hypothetical protein
MFIKQNKTELKKKQQTNKQANKNKQRNNEIKTGFK